MYTTDNSIEVYQCLKPIAIKETFTFKTPGKMLCFNTHMGLLLVITLVLLIIHLRLFKES